MSRQSGQHQRTGTSPLLRATLAAVVGAAVVASLVLYTGTGHRGNGYGQALASTPILTSSPISYVDNQRSATLNKSVRAVKAYARKRVGPRQWPCLNQLWIRESNWRYRATNPYSGAYGIPQSLPASKMRSAGADWRTNPYTQVKWGLRYIKSRYGTPCGAWRHWRSHHWY